MIVLAALLNRRNHPMLHSILTELAENETVLCKPSRIPGGHVQGAKNLDTRQFVRFAHLSLGNPDRRPATRGSPRCTTACSDIPAPGSFYLRIAESIGMR